MLFSLLLSVAAGVALVHAATPNDVLNAEWDTFKLRFKKSYGNEVQEQFRKKVYTENKHKIALHNKKFLNGEVKFSMGMNAFGDITHQEFLATRMGLLKRNYRNRERNGTTFMRMENIELPDEVNWVDEGYVTPIKDQQECGSCYSFSATGALEGQHKRKTGELVSLSEQNLVDCSSKYGNQGCDGGLPEFSFKYIKENKGIDTEESYPYENEVGKCHFNAKDVGATDTGFVELTSEDEDELKEAVATIGPISVGIDASLDSFQFYKTGVYDEKECSSENLGHAVLAVGYGNYEGHDFWLVKNSWGEKWGLSGYVRMSRNKDNQCGIATQPSYPLV